jgi:hypothetical protein
VTSRYQAAQLVRQLCGGEFVSAYGSIPLPVIRPFHGDARKRTSNSESRREGDAGPSFQPRAA